MTKNQNFHIVLEYREELESSFATELTKGLENDGLQFKINKTTYGPFASLDWAIPGLIAAYILKPYFDSFLQEAGKDHYQILKNWIKKIALLSRSLRVSKITASQSTEKVDNTDTQSKAFSVYLELSDKRKMKLLFDETLENEIWEKNIDDIFDLVLANHEAQANDKLSSLLADLKDDYRVTIYAIIDPNTKKWTFWDNRKLLVKIREKKNSS